MLLKTLPLQCLHNNLTDLDLATLCTLRLKYMQCATAAEANI